MSGKSHYVGKLIRSNREVFDKEFDEIIYVYDEWQPLYDDLLASHPGITFTKNTAKIFEDKEYFNVSRRTLLVLDDVANTMVNNPAASKLFTQKIHHKNVSILFLLNNLYKQGKAMRDIHLNASYIIMFKNVRDTEQITLLSRQMGLRHLSDAYNTIMSEPYQPIVLDLKSDTPDYLRVRSHILPGEEKRIYIDPERTSLPGNV